MGRRTSRGNLKYPGVHGGRTTGFHLCLLACLTVGLGARTAHAWNFTEHRDICRLAYEGACEAIGGEATSMREPAKLRWELACNPSRGLADLYGQACGLAGDKVATAEDLMTALGGSRAASDVYYYKLALYNSEHFQPQSLRYWLEHHAKAVAQARKAADLRDTAEIEAFERAVFMSAFADHFLVDSFASGHMGFNRKASTAGASKAIHDVWNEHGRWLRAADGCEWFTLGDGNFAAAYPKGEGEGGTCLEDERIRKQADSVPAPRGTSYDPRTQRRLALERMLMAATPEVQEVLETFIFGAARRDHAKRVWDLVPIQLAVIHKPKRLLHFAADDFQSPKQRPAPEQYEQLAAVRMPAKYAYAYSVVPETRWQRRFSGGNELDLMLQATIGPYRAETPVIRGAYLNLRLGYGFDLESREAPRSGHRQGMAAGFDVELPFLRSSNGFAVGSLVLGAHSLWWPKPTRFAPLSGLRLSGYLGPFILQLTAGVADVVYDDEAAGLGWARWRGALFTSISGSLVEGKYPGGGVPQARVIGDW